MLVQLLVYIHTKLLQNKKIDFHVVEGRWVWVVGVRKEQSEQRQKGTTAITTMVYFAWFNELPLSFVRVRAVLFPVENKTRLRLTLHLTRRRAGLQHRIEGEDVDGHASLLHLFHEHKRFLPPEKLNEVEEKGRNGEGSFLKNRR